MSLDFVLYILLMIVASAACIVWTALAVYKQIRPNVFNRNNDPFSMIPIWTLFSPKPMRNISLVAYRDQKKNGETTKIEIMTAFVPKWYRMLWYGQRRDMKFIVGLKRQLLKNHKNPYLFAHSTSFYLIRNYLKHYNNDGTIQDRQVIYFTKGGFMIGRKDKVLFVTNIKC